MHSQPVCVRLFYNIFKFVCTNHTLVSPACKWCVAGGKLDKLCSAHVCECRHCQRRGSLHAWWRILTRIASASRKFQTQRHAFHRGSSKANRRDFHDFSKCQRGRCWLLPVWLQAHGSQFCLICWVTDISFWVTLLLWTCPRVFSHPDWWLAPSFGNNRKDFTYPGQTSWRKHCCFRE